MTDLLFRYGPLINRSLSAAIAIITLSFLLYTIVNDYRNRVARIFSTLLFFILITFVSDLGVTYSDTLGAAGSWLRFQWLGIAFTPAAHVHLSDAILELTGLPSRGRRRLLTRVLYVLSGMFLALVWGSDWVVHSPIPDPAPHFQVGPVFPVFAAYFFSCVAVSYWFAIRAYRRTLTGASRRRMTYLLIVYAAPALAVFPFLLISGRSLETPLVFYGILTLVDAALVVMISGMGYVLSFFGAIMPDRLIKVRMLEFLLRGPLVAITTLAVIVWGPRLGGLLLLPGDEIMPLMAVITILALQWVISAVQPWLESLLVYGGNESEVNRIRSLERRLVTGADFQQLLESILVATCDYLRVRAAFVASFEGETPTLEKAIGLQDEFGQQLASSGDLPVGNGNDHALNGAALMPAGIPSFGSVLAWHGFWLIPLHVQTRHDARPRLIGLLGIEAPSGPSDLLNDAERWRVLMALATRVAEVLEDRRVQAEVFATLDGLLPHLNAAEDLRSAVRFGSVGALADEHPDEVLDSADFAGKIKEALQHYWGGPALTDQSLMGLNVVRQALAANDGNPQRAMRQVLLEAIENLRPEGKRSLTTAEWILYNILEMRFVQQRKVREVALRLAMSEADFYRKQRIAIENVAGIIAAMERASAEPGAERLPATEDGEGSASGG